MNETENAVMEEVVDETEKVTEDSGIGTGLAMLIGSGITLAAMAGVKGLRKLLDRYRAKKEKADIIKVVPTDNGESELSEDEE